MDKSLLSAGAMLQFQTAKSMCTQELLLNAMLGGLRTILSALQGVVGDVTIACGQCIARCEMVIDSCPKQQLLQVVGGDSEVAVLHLRVDTPLSNQTMLTEIPDPIDPRILSLDSRKARNRKNKNGNSHFTVFSLLIRNERLTC